MVKSKYENGELNQINYRMAKQIEERVKIFEKPKDAENILRVWKDRYKQ